MRGKLIWKSLKPDKLSVAQLRLADFTKEHRTRAEAEGRVNSGKLAFKDALGLFRERLEANQGIKESAKVHRRKCIETLLRTWPGLEALPASKIGKDECVRWAARLAKNYSPSEELALPAARRHFESGGGRKARGSNAAGAWLLHPFSFRKSRG